MQLVHFENNGQWDRDMQSGTIAVDIPLHEILSASIVGIEHQ